MSAEKLVQALTEGDVYNFTYSDAERARTRMDLNWCFDGQVVVRNGRLCDTYWGFNSGESRIVTPEQGTLTFVCNLNDVIEIQHYQTRRYDDADVFNLSHQHGCHKLFVRRKDAQPSATKMLAQIDDRMREVRHEAERAVRSALCDIELLTAQRAKVEAGNLEVHLGW